MAEKRIDPVNGPFDQDNHHQSKKALRESVISRRSRIPKQERESHSEAITKRAVALLDELSTSGFLKPGDIIHLFRSFGEEVETSSLLKRIEEKGFELVVPVVIRQGKTSGLFLSALGQNSIWVSGTFQIPEPHPVLRVDPSLVSLFFLPGVAFDRSGARIGYGKGYYDRILATISPDIPRVALAFSHQVLQTIPSSKWDIPMTMILTEQETICCD